MITDVGLQHMADQMAEQGQAQMSHVAVGSGTTAAAAGDTTLETELARVALGSVVRSDKKVTYTATFGPGVGTGALTEAGILNAASVGVLLTRIVFTVKNKGAGDTMSVTIEHTYQRV